MKFAVECSKKTQCRTAITAAAIACFFQTCQEDGEKQWVESRPTASEQLEKYDARFGKHSKSKFMCANQALLLFNKDPSFYNLTCYLSESNFCREMIPPLRALMVNEEILCKIICDVKEHFEEENIFLPSFLKNPGFQDLIHQYFKTPESLASLSSELGMETKEELFEKPKLPERPSKESVVQALDATLHLARNRLLRNTLNNLVDGDRYLKRAGRVLEQTLNSTGRVLEQALNKLAGERMVDENQEPEDAFKIDTLVIPSHIEMMQQCVFNLLCICHSRDARELASRLNIRPTPKEIHAFIHETTDDQIHSFVNGMTEENWEAIRDISCNDCYHFARRSEDILRQSKRNKSEDVKDQVTNLSVLWSEHLVKVRHQTGRLGEDQSLFQKLLAKLSVFRLSDWLCCAPYVYLFWVLIHCHMTTPPYIELKHDNVLWRDFMKLVSWADEMETLDAREIGSDD
eukprot:Gregarina_sp_Poly_1__1278@NODE_1310_length_4420_cov_29_168390_g886_i0_p1_GENE_NODE_1310_length_4420_cov_29_168390_g886_i0NODE_1310_length_4420_cov_29_168390_g886_i0_p1_ORF_typecomplete_len460_score62_71DUF3659/PF12396_8/0_18_NODE_1310_length_4420_cov_29_168390_g886_i018463225